MTRSPRPQAGVRAGQSSGKPSGKSPEQHAGKRVGASDQKPAGKKQAGAPAVLPARERVLRLFFGLALPEAVGQELVAAQAKLTSNWRKVEQGQLHITLAYLPGVPEPQVAALRELGKRLAAEAAPITLRLRGTGYHPNVGTPRVWFVKVEGEGLTALAARFGAELERLGFPPEGKFQPHITLARKKGPAPRLPPLGFTQEWEAGQISLIHTFLPRDKTGPVYDTVTRFHLTGSAHLSHPDDPSSDHTGTATSPTPPPTDDTPPSEE